MCRNNVPQQAGVLLFPTQQVWGCTQMLAKHVGTTKLFDGCHEPRRTRIKMHVQKQAETNLLKGAWSSLGATKGERIQRCSTNNTAIAVPIWTILNESKQTSGCTDDVILGQMKYPGGLVGKKPLEDRHAKQTNPLHPGGIGRSWIPCKGLDAKPGILIPMTLGRKALQGISESNMLPRMEATHLHQQHDHSLLFPGKQITYSTRRSSLASGFLVACMACSSSSWSCLPAFEAHRRRPKPPAQRPFSGFFGVNGLEPGIFRIQRSGCPTNAEQHSIKDIGLRSWCRSPPVCFLSSQAPTSS